MAKKKGVNKTEKVLEYWNQHPNATAAEVAEAMKKQGTEVKVSYIYNIRTQSRKKSGKKKVGRKARKAKTQAAAAQAPAAAAPEKRSEPAGTVTLEHIKVVAQTIKAIGGFGKLNELVSLIREVGGLRKFKDLVDAITAAGSGAIPF
jgi:hypothetical protein